MTDREETSTTDTSQSVTSSLSDSWSMVNQHGDILDDESCSTTSSVEVVDEEEDENVSQQTSLGASPEVMTPKGPLFVLRLSSHEVSDTDDDQTPSGVTDSVEHSQSFDVLNDSSPVNLTNQTLDISHSGYGGKVDDSLDTTPNNTKPEEKIQTSYPSIDVEEHIGSLVKAIDEVQQNFQINCEGSRVSKLPSQPDLIQDDESKNENSGSFHINQGPSSLASEKQSILQSESGDVLVETVGPVLQANTEDVEESLDSSSFLGINTDTHETEYSPSTSESTVIDQSMERTEHAGSQQMVDSAEEEEPDANIVEQETENQMEGHDLELGRKIRQLYTFMEDMFMQWRQGLTIDSLIAYMSAAVVIMFLASTYTAYTVVVKKEKTSKYVEEFQHLLDNYNYIQEELNRCHESEKGLKLELAKADTSCEVSLKEANKIIGKWTYTSPDNLQAETDQYFQELELSCKPFEKKSEEDLGNNNHMASIKKRVNMLTFLLKRAIDENIELKKLLQGSYTDISKLKKSLEDTELKLEQAEGDLFGGNKKKEKRRDTDRQEDCGKDENLNGDYKQQKFDSDADGEAGDEEDEQKILFDKCLNVMMDYSHKILKEKYNTHWYDFGSHSIRDHLLGYLENIMPENLWYFMQAVKPQSTHSDEASCDSPNEEQENGYKHGNSWFGRGHETDTDSKSETGESDYVDQGFNQDGSYERTSNEQGKQSDHTGSYSGHWTDSVLEMMNKTRIQLQDTWQQVKNVSEEMWTKHKPAITKLQNTFTRKIQQLSDKFQQKVAKKVEKWFNRSKNRKRKNNSKSKDSDEANFSKTTRRGDKNDNSQHNKQTHMPYICSRDIIEVQNTILKLNAKKFKRLDYQRYILKQLKRIRRKEQITEGDVKTWLDCQIDWWSSNVAKPLELPQYLVTEKCFDFVECWQIHISEGNHGIGRKKCQRVKRASGNIMEDICSGTSYAFGGDEDLYDETDEASDDDEQLHKEREWDGTGHSDDCNDDNDDEQEISDEEIENWFLRRAEMREYHHAEPDNWYFRRLKKWQQDTKKHDDL